jgi:hypothetical protein
LGSVAIAGSALLIHSRTEERLIVNRKITPPIPEAIVQLQRQLDQFRSSKQDAYTLGVTCRRSQSSVKSM